MGTRRFADPARSNPVYFRPDALKGVKMQANLWEEKEPRHQRRKRRSRQLPTAAPYSITGDNDCGIIGHTLNMFDLSGCTTCMDCGAKIFCPTCTPNHPTDRDAIPVSCPRHEESQVQHAV